SPHASRAVPGPGLSSAANTTSLAPGSGTTRLTRTSGQIVPSGENVTALAALPAAALRLDSATLETLARLGIETVGEVLALPRSGLASRFGHELLTRIHQVL